MKGAHGTASCHPQWCPRLRFTPVFELADTAPALRARSRDAKLCGKASGVTCGTGLPRSTSSGSMTRGASRGAPLERDKGRGRHYRHARRSARPGVGTGGPGRRRRVGPRGGQRQQVVQRWYRLPCAGRMEHVISSAGGRVPVGGPGQPPGGRTPGGPCPTAARHARRGRACSIGWQFSRVARQGGVSGRGLNGQARHVFR